MTIAVIKASEFVVFDLQTTGDLNIELSDGSSFACNLFRIHPDDRAELIKACLENHIVIGRDLPFAFAWCSALTDFWITRCTLDVSALARLFLVDPAKIAGLAPLAALFCMTGTDDFDAAYEEVHNLDRLFHGAFFGAVEKVAYGARAIIKKSLQNALINHLEALEFKASLGCDKNDFVLRSQDGKTAMKFDKDHFPEVDVELEQSLETATMKILALLDE